MNSILTPISFTCLHPIQAYWEADTKNDTRIQGGAHMHASSVILHLLVQLLSV